MMILYVLELPPLILVRYCTTTIIVDRITLLFLLQRAERALTTELVLSRDTATWNERQRNNQVVKGVPVTYVCVTS